MKLTKKVQKNILILFILSRIVIWIWKPVEFTEIIYSYMPYAHRWASGDQPYLDQWFEYPPATIPLFYLPHIIDVKTYGTPLHLNYGHAYRGLLLLTDIAIFIVLWKVLKKTVENHSVIAGALIYYILATTKANHFLYDTMDLTFAGAITLGVASPILFKSQVSSFFGWFGFFLATALKYVNAPLALFYAALERKNLRRLFISATLAFLIIWALPLAKYRSSLSVTFVYHQLRGLQIASTPAVIAWTIDHVTGTEKIVEKYKNYEITGPYSDQIKRGFDILFPLSILVYVAYASKVATKTPEKKSYITRLHFTLGLIFLIMITGKVQSTPFLLWHIPLVAMYPFKSKKDQLYFTISSLIIIIFTMTRIKNIPIGTFSLHLFIGWLRNGLFLFMFIRLMKQAIPSLSGRQVSNK